MSDAVSASVLHRNSVYVCLFCLYGVSTAESWFAADTSSGYLEDAINGWDIWCKQHNLPTYSQDSKVKLTTMHGFMFYTFA